MRRKRNALGADVTWYFFRYCRPAHHDEQRNVDRFAVALRERRGVETRSCRVPRRYRREFASRRRMGGRRDQQRRNQPLRRQESHILGNLPRLFSSIGERTDTTIDCRSWQPISSAGRSRCSLQPVANLRPRRHRQLPKRYLSCSPRTALQQVGALIGASDSFLFGRRDQIVSLAAHYRISMSYATYLASIVVALLSYPRRERTAEQNIEEMIPKGWTASPRR
jgi:hypothetical protein